MLGLVVTDIQADHTCRGVYYIDPLGSCQSLSCRTWKSESLSSILLSHVFTAHYFVLAFANIRSFFLHTISLLRIATQRPLYIHEAKHRRWSCVGWLPAAAAEAFLLLFIVQLVPAPWTACFESQLPLSQDWRKDWVIDCRLQSFRI